MPADWFCGGDTFLLCPDGEKRGLITRSVHSKRGIPVRKSIPIRNHFADGPLRVDFTAFHQLLFHFYVLFGTNYCKLYRFSEYHIVNNMLIFARNHYFYAFYRTDRTFRCVFNHFFMDRGVFYHRISL